MQQSERALLHRAWAGVRELSQLSGHRLGQLSFRSEFYDDMQGQPTGTKTRYVEFGLGWQHWFSPQVYIGPEITFDKSLDAPAFNGNAAAGNPPNKDYSVIGAMDLIWKF
jgi:hypothetical protein